MISEYKIRELLWVDVVAPTKEELVDLKERFNISEKAVIYPLSESSDVKILTDNMVAFISLPVIGYKDKFLTTESILFMISNKYIVSLHDYDFQFIHEFTHSVSANKLIKTTNLSHHPLNILTTIKDAMYQELNTILHKNVNKISKLEATIEKNSIRKSVDTISYINRDINTIKSVLAQHFMIAEKLPTILGSLFAENTNDIGDKMNATILILKNKAESMQDTLSNRMEESIRIQYKKHKTRARKVFLLGSILVLSGIIFAILTQVSDKTLIRYEYGYFMSIILIVLGAISITTALIRIKKWL